MKWRCIDTTDNNAAFNMALDEALLETVSKGESLPILRFYGWNPPAISLGYFQKIENSIDSEFCKANGIDIVRRITGGRTVLHNHELTYSIIIPESSEFVKGSITEAYKKISIGLLEGLKLCNINAEFSPGIAHQSSTSACFEASSKYEIVIDGKKLVGSAQTRKKGVVLQHGSIMISFDTNIFAGCLGLSGAGKEKFVLDYKNKAATIECDYGKYVGKELLIKNIKKSFEEFGDNDLLEDTTTKNEEILSKELEKKYSSYKWTFLR